MSDARRRPRRRAAALLAGVWAGALLAIGGIAAPVGFRQCAAPAVAGRIAGRMFALEAQSAWRVAVVLILLLRAHARAIASRSRAARCSAPT